MPRRNGRVQDPGPELTTVINFILDRSGSMSVIRDSVISGFNEYLNGLKVDQAANPENPILFSLTLFDLNRMDPITEQVYWFEPVAQVAPLTDRSYIPRGSTPLYDAACQAIRTCQARVVLGKVAFLTTIMTDGQENASQAETKDSLKALIASLEKEGNWTFTYMGANQDAFQEAAQFATASTLSNTANWDASQAGTRVAFAATTGSTTSYLQSMRVSARTGQGLSTTDFYNPPAPVVTPKSKRRAPKKL